MKVLLTGGAGYVGSHVARECQRAGHEPVVFDNYITGHPAAVAGLMAIQGDLLDRDSIRYAFDEFRFDAVIHFAAPRGPSAAIEGTLNLLGAMHKAGVKDLILSSSAAVYGEPAELPVHELHTPEPATPRGRSKLVIERTLATLARQDRLRYIILRTFNVSGADPSSDTGDDRPESRLISKLLLTALMRFSYFEIFGEDYDTRDGTCVRDFVHVIDAALAHVQALESFDRCPNETFNIGSGVGYSVNEIVDAAQRVTRLPLTVRFGSRRFGDPPEVVASIERAKAGLGWEPICSHLDTILETAWHWHRLHPTGYAGRELRHGRLARSPEPFRVRRR